MPLDKDKKKKLRKLLGELDPESKVDLVAQSLEEEIKSVGEGLSRIKDSSGSIGEIRDGLKALKDTLLSKLEELPTKDSIEGVKKKYSDEIENLKVSIDSIITDIESTLLVINSEVEGNKEEAEKELKKVKGDLERLEREFIHRGGSANQQIKVNGTIATERYADINIVAPGAVVTNDDTNRNTKIDLTLSGGVDSVSNSNGSLTISPTTGAVVASLNLANPNTWTGQQTFNTSAPIFGTMTAGSVLFAGTAGLLSQDNTNFFYNNTLDRLGIGINSSIKGALHLMPVAETINPPSSPIGTLQLETLIAAPTNSSSVYLTPGAADVTGLSVTPVDLGSGGFDDSSDVEIQIWAVDNTTHNGTLYEVASPNAASDTITSGSVGDTYNLDITWNAVAGADFYIVRINDPNFQDTYNIALTNSYTSTNSDPGDASQPQYFPIISTGTTNRDYKVHTSDLAPSGSATYYSVVTNYSITPPATNELYVIGHLVGNVSGNTGYKFLGADNGTSFDRSNTLAADTVGFLEYSISNGAYDWWGLVGSSNVTVTPNGAGSYGTLSVGQTYKYQWYSKKNGMTAYTFYSATSVTTSNITFPNDSQYRYIDASATASDSEDVTTYRVLRSTNGGSTFPGGNDFGATSFSDDNLRTWSGGAALTVTPTSAPTPAIVMRSEVTPTLVNTSGASLPVYFGTTGSGTITGMTFGGGLTNKLGHFFLNSATSAMTFATNGSYLFTNLGQTTTIVEFNQSTGFISNPNNLATATGNFTIKGGTSGTQWFAQASSNKMSFGTAAVNAAAFVQFQKPPTALVAANNATIAILDQTSQTGLFIDFQNSSASTIASIDNAGRFRAMSGSAGSPSQSYFNDNDTGSFNPTANHLGFSAGGEFVMRVTATGVGIGAEGNVPTPTTTHLSIANGTTAFTQLQFGVTGALKTAATAGSIEALTDDIYYTITTGTARKKFVLNDGTDLTSGRVPFATTNGRLTDDADMTFSGSRLTVTDLTSTNAPIVSSLTAGRVVFAGASKELVDDADFTFATDTLTATKIVGTTSIKVGTAAGYISSDGSTGATGTFTTADAKTVTVKDGIITNIV